MSQTWIESSGLFFLARAIDCLPSKWEAVIEVDSKYVLEYSIKYDFNVFKCRILHNNNCFKTPDNHIPI